MGDLENNAPIHDLKTPSESMFSAERLRKRLAHCDMEKRAAKTRRKAERAEGKLSGGLHEKLAKCSIAELRTVKRLCNRLITRQTTPPASNDCPNEFAVKVVASFGFKNKLFRAELKRTTRRADKVYVNGPYVYAYHWDGAYVRPKYYGSKFLSEKLPLKVWNALKDKIAGPEIEELKARLSEKWSQGFGKEQNAGNIDLS